MGGVGMTVGMGATEVVARDEVFNMSGWTIMMAVAVGV